MWRSCPRVLDEPVIVLAGLELDDFLVLGVMAAVLMIVASLLVFVLGTLGAILAVLKGKRGKPPGALLHWVHDLELPFLQLPGVLPARELIYSPW